jgi:hypothetical protein
MGKRLLAAVVLLLAAGIARADNRGAVDWIFLVDTSQSMRGVGGTKDIFGDVKESIGTFIAEAREGDSITIFTFDRDAQLRVSMDVGKHNRAQLSRIVDELRADGSRTHLGAAIAKGLEHAESLQQQNDPSRERAIVLFTDGKEDVRGIRDPVTIPSTVQRAQKIRPWIFFVSLGEHEPQLDAFASETERTKVLKPRDAEAIRAATLQIRTILAPAEVSISPKTIRFGALHAGETSEERELTITSDKQTIVSVALEGSPGVTMPRRDNITVSSVPVRIPLRVSIAKDADPGARALRLRAGDDVIEGSVEVIAPSPFIRIAKWIGAIAILSLLAVIGFILYSGKMPGELLASFSGRNHLEGEIEIVAPRTNADAAYVGLPTMKAKEVALSAIVPIDALAGSDARLFCRRRSGEKTVWIAADKGTLRVNDVELPMSELYDADTIEIGDAKLRFNRVGHERPSLEGDLS